jgi:hypothetical protein
MKPWWTVLALASLSGGAAWAQQKPAEPWPHGPYDKIRPRRVRGNQTHERRLLTELLMIQF